MLSDYILSWRIAKAFNLTWEEVAALHEQAYTVIPAMWEYVIDGEGPHDPEYVKDRI